jgi:hypothetical protein
MQAARIMPFLLDEFNDTIAQVVRNILSFACDLASHVFVNRQTALTLGMICFSPGPKSALIHS